jgi:hypothetical protein
VRAISVYIVLDVYLYVLNKFLHGNLSFKIFVFVEGVLYIYFYYCISILLFAFYIYYIDTLLI